MGYLRNKFIQVGDTFKAEQETFHFHRGMTYTVSHVFNDNGNFRFFITDKHGLDIEYREYYFAPTAKTATASHERQKKARLDFFWDNCQTSFVLNKSYHYNFETTEFFDFENRAVFGGQGMEGVKARISRYKKQMVDERWRHHKVEGTEANFYNKEDFYKYFKNIDVVDDLRINGLYSDPQSAIDMNYFMLSVPHFDETLLTRPQTLEMTEINQYVHRTPMELDGFIDLVADVIFDEEVLSDENKLIVSNVMEAFELLPKSYGPTAASKLLMGKEKKENKTVKHLSGTCTTLKQPQIFTLCDMVESYLYVNGIFVTKDEYSNGVEWRGDYEFIGSKMVNFEKLTILKSMLR